MYFVMSSSYCGADCEQAFVCHVNIRSVTEHVCCMEKSAARICLRIRPAIPRFVFNLLEFIYRLPIIPYTSYFNYYTTSRAVSRLS